MPLEDRKINLHPSLFYEIPWTTVHRSPIRSGLKGAILPPFSPLPNSMNPVTYLKFDSGRYQNQTGVEIRAYQFGNLTGIAALDPSLPSVSGSYEKLISGLKGAGYSEGQDIFGAPYDFRLAADGLEQVVCPPHNSMGLCTSPPRLKR